MGFAKVKVKVTKEQFEAYVEVQKRGRTNMFAVKTVSRLSGLDENVIFMIMDTYSKLEKKFKETGK